MTLESLAQLAPAFLMGGTVTAGTSSGINGGRRRSRWRVIAMVVEQA